ncbi:hypothetical protein [Coxiella burnetii]|uniref:hypothetical protein n=1 Tax=Coxiella burnetii TaxID=777 RepID=UPI00051F1AD0|nr:hypothetical protein [Coxiella burnetii]AIT63583.1 Putative membrane protein [Coxiella burnetii str. Namibia]
MKEQALMRMLLTCRLTNYKLGILERLQRFKLLSFFILAMVVPTVAFMKQLIESASMGLLQGGGNIAHFVYLIIFQTIVMIWVGSQYDCLRIPDVENYLRTLKISLLHFVTLEFIFISVVTLPFLIFLVVGVALLIVKQFALLGISHFIYILSSSFLISSFLIFSRPGWIILLIVSNFAFVYFNGSIGAIIFSVILILASSRMMAQKYFSLKMNRIGLFPKNDFSKFFPNIYLNIKSLFVWNKIYTYCIIGINSLIFFIFVSYLLSDRAMYLHISFLVTLNAIMFFCALLIYKLSETRLSYGLYFNLFYNKAQFYLFDLSSIFLIVLLHFLIIGFVNLYLGVNLGLMLKSMLIALLSLFLFIALNRKFPFYGPVLSLLTASAMLIISRGLL